MTRLFFIFAWIVAFSNCVAEGVPNHFPPGEKMYWGGSSFTFHQLPLENKLTEFEKSNGMIFTGDFGNPRGYVASWRLVGRTLTLEAVEGKLVDSKRTVLDVVKVDSLPCKAVWFTGLLCLPIGEFNFDKQQWPMVLKIRIVEGDILATEILYDVKGNVLLVEGENVLTTKP